MKWNFMITREKKKDDVEVSVYKNQKSAIYTICNCYS